MRTQWISAALRYSSVLFILLLFTSHAHASGFAIFTQGASALGGGDASIADPDGPSSLFFNPALINDLDGTRVEAGSTFIIPARTFTSDATGVSVDAKEAVFFPTTFFATHRYSEKMSAGLAVFTPFGLGTDWGDTWEGRYIATKSEMISFNVNPTLSYRVSPALTLAGGLNILSASAVLEKRLNIGKMPLTLGAPDGGQKLEGDGLGVGFNLGLLVQVGEDLSIGAAYRSAIDVTFEGDVTHTDIPPVLSGAFPAATGFRTDITFPRQAHLGLSYRGVPDLTLSAAVRWEGWSTYDRLTVESDLIIGGSTTNVTTKNWDDVYALMVGGRYTLPGGLELSGGYFYGENPVPDETFESSIPDSDSHLVTLGTGFFIGKIKVDLAYGYQHFAKRRKNNTIDDGVEAAFDPLTSANGEYETAFHLLAGSVTYAF